MTAANPVRALERLVLNNGVVMPAIGLGVYQSPPHETAAAVDAALRAGYRHIDTAAAYGNEREVGEGVRRSGVDRRDVFIETKVWVSEYGYDSTLHACVRSSRRLGFDQIDLLVLHHPAPALFDSTVDSYMALEALLADGRVRAIGVSNFMSQHLSNLMARTEIVPAVNQIELHPYFSQPDMQKVHAHHGVVTQAWSPLGGITFYPPWGHESKSVMKDEVIGAIASQHAKTPAQVMLRWHLQQGRSAIPKSVNPSRIAENLEVFDFELSADELTCIDRLNTGRRGGSDPDKPPPGFFDLPTPEP